MILLRHSVGLVKRMTDRLTDKQAISNGIPVRFYRLQASVYTEALSYTVALGNFIGVLSHAFVDAIIWVQNGRGAPSPRYLEFTRVCH